MKNFGLYNIQQQGISIIVSPTENARDLDCFLQTFTEKNSFYPVEVLIPTGTPSEEITSVIDKYRLKCFIMPVKCSPAASGPVIKNTAANEAVYPYLLFIDSRIIYTADVLPRAFKMFENPLIGLVGTRLDQYLGSANHDEARVIHSGITFKWNREQEQFEPVIIGHKTFPGINQLKNGPFMAVSSSFLFCSKEDFMAVAGFNEQLEPGLAEVEFCLRLQSRLKKVCFCLNEKPLHLSKNHELEAKKPFSAIEGQKANNRPGITEYGTANKFSGKIAVVCHVFYFEQWPFLAHLIRNIPAGFHLFVTVPENSKAADREKIIKKFPEAKISLHPNRGRDIAPFLEVLPEIINNDYDLVCKVHTKKDDPVYGDVWRWLMLQATLGSSELVSLILDKFAAFKNLGMTGPALLYKSSKALMYNNLGNIRKIRQLMPGKPVIPEDWGFFPGSCFWARPASLATLAETVKQLDFEDDNTQTDGQLAHAAERLFGLAVMEAGLSLGLVSISPGKIREPAFNMITPPGSPSTEIIEHTMIEFVHQHITGLKN